MKLIFIFSIVFFQIFFIYLVKIMKVVRTLGIDAFMDDEMLPLFLGNKDVETVRTPESCVPGKTTFLRAKPGITYFAENLPLAAIVFIKIRFWGVTAWTFTVIINVADGTSADRFYGFTVAPLDVRNVITVVPNFVVKDFWKFVDFKLLVFRGLGIIKSPLLERNKSANKIKKLADNFLLVFDVLK